MSYIEKKMNLIDVNNIDCTKLPKKLYPYMKDILDFFDVQPTIDARPIIHAKWKRFAMSTIAFECSNCKVICQNAYSLETSKNNFNFCPNCGAKMFEPQESEDT